MDIETLRDIIAELTLLQDLDSTPLSTCESVAGHIYAVPRER